MIFGLLFGERGVIGGGLSDRAEAACPMTDQTVRRMRGACAGDLVAQDVIRFVVKNRFSRSACRVMAPGRMSGHGFAHKRGEERQQERGGQ